MYMKQESQQHLLNLSRQTLEYYFRTSNKLEIDKSEVGEELKDSRGTFVTLTKNGELRGCIGHNEAIQPIYLDVIDNTLSAAFEDNRFESLQESELKDLHIEISVLTKPKKLNYSSAEDLLNQLRPLVDGVIIEKGIASATYLPQVWEGWSGDSIKVEFLSSLCQKAGLSQNEWKTGDLEVYTYQAEVFHE
jgi:uncharacterized protein